MSIVLGIIEFLCSVIAIFVTWILIINIISSVINPQIVIKDGVAIEENYNSRLLFALIIAISWGIVIVIP
jgi:hypothetical protein